MITFGRKAAEENPASTAALSRVVDQPEPAPPTAPSGRRTEEGNKANTFRSGVETGNSGGSHGRNFFKANCWWDFDGDVHDSDAGVFCDADNQDQRFGTSHGSEPRRGSRKG